MVLKTEPDRSVRSSTGHDFGPIRSIRPKIGSTGIGLVEPAVRSVNQSVLSKLDGSINLFIFCLSASKRRRFDVSGVKTTSFWRTPSKPSLSSNCSPPPTRSDRLPQPAVSPQWQSQLYFLLQQWQQEHQVPQEDSLLHRH